MLIPNMTSKFCKNRIQILLKKAKDGLMARFLTYALQNRCHIPNSHARKSPSRVPILTAIGKKTGVGKVETAMVFVFLNLFWNLGAKICMFYVYGL